MNRHISKLGLITAIGALAAGTAFAGPLEMSISSGSQSTGAFNVVSGTSYANSDFNGWNISYFTPVSNSPSTQPFGLDLGGLVAACGNASGCSSLTVFISDTGFTTPVGMGDFTTGLANNQMGLGTGTVMQTAYYDAGNAYMGETGTIGSITLNGFGSQTVSGGGPASGMYSLTLVDTFSASCNTAGCAAFSIDGNISDVPEPGTLALFGAGLLGCGLFLVRRRRARQS